MVFSRVLKCSPLFLLGLLSVSASGAPAHVSSADKLFDDAKYEQARAAYAGQVKASPREFAPRVGLIRTLFRLNDWSAAVDAARATTTAFPQTADAHGLLSLSLMRAGLPTDAIKEADVAAKIDKDSYWTLLAEARSLFWQYKLDDAHRLFQRATGQHPDWEEAWEYWASSFDARHEADIAPIVDALRKLEEKKHPKKLSTDAEKAKEARQKADWEKRKAYNALFVKEPPFHTLKPYNEAQIKEADEGKIPPVSFTFPIERKGDDIIVPITLEGVRLHMLFDTGAGHALSLSQYAAERINAPVLAKALVGGVSGIEVSKLHKADKLAIGDGVWSNVPFDSIDNKIGSHDGLIGGAVFENYVVTVDLQDNAMTLTRGKEAVAPPPLQGDRVVSVPFHFYNGYIFIQISAENHPSWAMLDTGAGGFGVLSLRLARQLAKEVDKESTAEITLTERLGIGISETSFTALLFGFNVDIGCLVGDRTPYFIQMDPMMGASMIDRVGDDYDFYLTGLIGIKYLTSRCHRVSFDYPHHILTMELPEE